MSSYAPTRVTWTAAQPATGEIRTSRTEMLHIGIAFVVLTFDLMLILGGADLLSASTGSAFAFVTLPVFAVAATAALTGFLAHELAHKVTAERHGFWAEFRMYPMGLLLSLITASVGFLFAAPGATVIAQMQDTREWGRTALAGPATNLLFGGSFYAGAALLFRPTGASPIVDALLLLAFVNGWFAAFNLVPIGPLDGRKVLSWDIGVWVAAFAGSALFAALCFLAVYYGIGPVHA